MPPSNPKLRHRRKLLSIVVASGTLAACVGDSVDKGFVTHAPDGGDAAQAEDSDPGAPGFVVELPDGAPDADGAVHVDAGLVVNPPDASASDAILVGTIPMIPDGAADG